MKTREKKEDKKRIDLKQILFIIIVALLLFVSAGTILSYVENPWGIKLYTVLTNSMEPTLRRGDLIVIRAADQYSLRDIITYKPPSGRLGGQAVESVTHRISDMQEIEGETYFFTKGDANEGQDIDPIQEEDIVGKFLFRFPLVGYLIEFTKTEIGLVLLIVIPGAIIVYDEVRKIFHTLSRRSSLQRGRNIV